MFSLQLKKISKHNPIPKMSDGSIPLVSHRFEYDKCCFNPHQATVQSTLKEVCSTSYYVVDDVLLVVKIAPFLDASLTLL